MQSIANSWVAFVFHSALRCSDKQINQPVVSRRARRSGSDKQLPSCFVEYHCVPTGEVLDERVRKSGATNKQARMTHEPTGRINITRARAIKGWDRGRNLHQPVKRSS